MRTVLILTGFYAPIAATITILSTLMLAEMYAFQVRVIVLVAIGIFAALAFLILQSMSAMFWNRRAPHEVKLYEFIAISNQSAGLPESLRLLHLYPLRASRLCTRTDRSRSKIIPAGLMHKFGSPADSGSQQILSLTN